MLAGAARAYVERYAVRPGTRAVVFTNNDIAYDAARALHDAGVEVAAVVDARAGPESGVPVQGRSRAAVRRRSSPRTGGDASRPSTSRRSRADAARRIDCDLVCVSGGYNPAVHLFSQARGTLRYDEALAAFVPDRSPLPVARRRRRRRRQGCAPRRPLWSVAAKGKRFVDLQNDVTVDDIELAAREGYTSVEHLKRYTTLGMGTDQGKTSNVIGLALLAQALGEPIADVGTTTFRPPYAPITLGAVPGDECGAHLAPARALGHARLARRARRTLRHRRAVAAPAFVSARGRDRGRGRQPRGAQRAHERRRRRRVHARQDRARRTRRRDVPGSPLRQHAQHARRRALPLRRDAARRRHGAGRRHRLAPRVDALPHDDDHRERGAG